MEKKRNAYKTVNKVAGFVSLLVLIGAFVAICLALLLGYEFNFYNASRFEETDYYQNNSYNEANIALNNYYVSNQTTKSDYFSYAIVSNKEILNTNTDLTYKQLEEDDNFIAFEYDALYKINDRYLLHEYENNHSLTNDKVEVIPGGKIYYRLDVTKYPYAELNYVHKFYNLVHNNLLLLVLGAILTVILGIIDFIYLCYAAGHNPDSDEVKANWYDSIPLDLLLVIQLALFIFIAIGAQSMNNIMGFYLVVFDVLYALIAGLIDILSMAVRFKTGTFITNTLTYKCAIIILKITLNIFAILGQSINKITKAVINLFKGIPYLWKIVAVLATYLLVNYFFLIIDDRFACLVINVLFCFLAYVYFYQLNRVRKLTDNIHNGKFEWDYPNLLFPEINKEASTLLSLQEGINNAVDEKLRSERLKTELITNISHDIKTPLTSIINYVDLIKWEKDEEKKKEYLEVLERNSKRLKKLIEDLVEASKASTGNIAVNLSPIDLNELVQQAAVEYEERFQKANLTLLTNVNVNRKVLADGKLLWRIIDNLLSNATKYSQPTTRVYLDAYEENYNMIIVVKNISNQMLNISADELMERFVRGDESRNSEGSGLGLNIAKSLVELQGGNLELKIDGDLFKAVVTLPASIL